ncbi:hypothetical protein CPB83DRAFT_903654 [Crepidotus variabilis]|uniref:Uncharacterized protein n=1 Tax=Crepidotus variabilis TaxID=179855 RepID=A0A9P6EP91_9AGAR|nr:hypothetical protein CPB83DRAFT_903654 [Crepidotus variabilis]
MSTTNSFTILKWIANVFVATLYFIKRLFKSSASEEVLPVASPVPPSTPSFIQSYEPNISDDAMQVFQLNCGRPRASRIARHKMAMAESRKGYPSAHWSQSSASPTDPSPGFSFLSLVPDNLAPVSGEPDSPSMYSTPPASPCPSTKTPSIVVSNTLGEFPPVHDDMEPEICIIQKVRTIPPRKSAEEDRPVCQFFPSVKDLAKRRLKFKGPPINTNIPKDLFMPSQPTTPVKELQEAEEEVEDPRFLSPKAAYFAVTEFVRSSTSLGSPPKSDKRRSSQESNFASPEYQDAFSAHSPFSTYSDSFYVDDHVPSSRMVDADINNVSFYSDFESTLNLSTIRPKRTRRSHISSSIPSAIEEDPSEALHDNTSVSAYSQVSEVDFCLGSPLASPLCKLTRLPDFLPEICLDEIPDSDYTECHNYLPPTLPTTSECTSPMDPDTLGRLSLYASLSLPFDLEEEIPLEDCPRVKLFVKITGRRCSREVPVLKKSSQINFVARDSVPLAKGAVLALKDTVNQTVVCERLSAPSEKSSPVSAPEITTDRAQTPLPCSSQPPWPVVQVSPSTMKMTRTRNRSATIVQPSASLETCSDNFVQLPHSSPSLKRDLVTVSHSTCPRVDSTHSVAHAVGSLSPLMALSPVESVSSVDSVLASPATPSEVYSPSVVTSSGNYEPQEFPRFGLVPGDMEAVLQRDVTDIKSGIVPIGKSRSRRIGIYGTLPHQMTKNLGQELPVVIERTSVGIQNDNSDSPTSRASKGESGLRQLVLPMHVAKRESLKATSTRHSRPSQADSSQVITRSSIGLPPSQPLPAVPGKESLKKGPGALLSKSVSELERLNKLIDLLDAIDLPKEEDRKFRSNRRPVETSSWSPDESDEDWDHASEDGSHFSWGIAL